jgi:GAF domain-containing protein
VPRPTEVAAALAEAAKTIDHPRSLEETLDAIVHAARDTIPGLEHVGISILHRDGRIETKAGTDQLVWELDDLQYGINQGPCVDAVKSDPIMYLDDARHDDRWPDYLPRAVEKGLRSQLALRLYTEEETLGGINMYSTTGPGLTPEAIQLAELFAAHASIALGRKRYEHQLAEAVASRQVIGTAVGILMERYQITESRAFQFLVRVSRTSNHKVRLIAQEVVDSSNQRFARPES